MKYLKLNSECKECHGLVRALVGSPVSNWWDDVHDGWTLEGMRDNRILVTSSRFTPKSSYTFELPLDTIKLNQFLAIQSGVILCAPDTDDFASHSISNNWSVGQLFTAIDTFGDKITLNLDRLPKGAEIVEVS